LEIKSVVVHFQGKTVNPEWKIIDNLLTQPLAVVTELMYQGSHKQDFGGGTN
jgi:predicted SAM-dependent methyltransferase